MERDELDRLRSEFERLYQQANFEQPDDFEEMNRSHSSVSDHPQGWWQRLQQFWQKMNQFFTENGNDSPHSDPFWWQVHSWRTGVYAPLFQDETSKEAKHWLEGLYHRSANDVDRR